MSASRYNGVGLQPKRHHRITILVTGVALGLISSFAYWHWANAPLTHVDVYDGFETHKLSRLWDTDRFERGAVTVQSQIVRAGHGAAKVVVHSRDKFEAGINGNNDSERAELREANRLISKEDKTYEYSFSMFIPPDFQIAPTRLVIAQWKQYCSGHAPCSDDSPVVALRYVSGVLRITHQTGRHHGMTLFETAEDIRGKWTEFRFQIRFTPRANGLLQAYSSALLIVTVLGHFTYFSRRQ